MQHHDGLREAAWPGRRFRKRMVQRLRQFGVCWSDDARAGNCRWRHDGRLAIVRLALEEARLASGMHDAASERPIVDRTAVYKAGKVGADLLPPPVDFVPQ